MSKRSGEAQAALGRKAPTMAHRLTPRGGARNSQSDAEDLLASEYGSDLVDVECDECGFVKCLCDDVDSFLDYKYEQVDESLVLDYWPEDDYE